MSDDICKYCKGPKERCHIDDPACGNCVHVAIEKNGSMTLHDVAKRLGISFVRVAQIEKKALAKLSTKIQK
jgi:hypothetical protein